MIELALIVLIVAALMLFLAAINNSSSKPAPNRSGPKLVTPQTNPARGSASRRQNVRQHATVSSSSSSGEEDRVGVISFASSANWVLLPTKVGDPGVASRIAKIASTRYFRGGGTNLSAGLETALEAMEKWKGGWVRRIIVVSDGEASVDEKLADRARAAKVTISAIFVGQGDCAVLRKLVGRTAGGWFETCTDFAALGRAMRRGGSVARSGNGRRGLVLILADTSSSMTASFPGAPGQGRRIDALIGAIADWRQYHGATYKQAVAVR